MTTTDVRQQARLEGVDVARGVALLGMMAVHVFPERGNDDGLTVAHLLASGRASALFAVLAGVGLALLARRATSLHRSVAVRAVLVALVGLLLGLVESGLAVILTYYGVLFLVALPLLRLSAPVLAALAVLFAVGGPVLSFLVRPSLPERAPGNPSPGLLLEAPVDLFWTLTVTGYYPVLCWTAYLCAGLAVGRLALGEPRVQVRLALGGAVLAAGASAVSSLLLAAGGREAIAASDSGRDVDGNQFGNVPTDTAWWLAVDAPHASTPPDLAHTTGTALLVLGLALLLARVAGAVLRPLAAAGAMTLTLYAVHVLVVAATDTEAHLLLWGVQVVAFAAFAVVWLRAFARGPLEQLVASAAGR